MMTTATIPVHISPEAERRLAEPGLRATFEQILNHVKQHTPGLRFIDVVYEDDSCVPADVHPWDKVILEVHRTTPAVIEEDQVEDGWRRWMIANFSPEILLTVMPTSFFEADDGR